MKSTSPIHTIKSTYIAKWKFTNCRLLRPVKSSVELLCAGEKISLKAL